MTCQAYQTNQTTLRHTPPVYTTPVYTSIELHDIHLEEKKKYASLSKTGRKIFNYIQFMCGKFRGSCFPSQQRIANYAGCTRETANRLVKKLVKMRMLIKTTPPYRSCIYRIPKDIEKINFKQYVNYKWDTFVKHRELSTLGKCHTASHTSIPIINKDISRYTKTEKKQGNCSGILSFEVDDQALAKMELEASVEIPQYVDKCYNGTPLEKKILSFYPPSALNKGLKWFRYKHESIQPRNAFRVFLSAVNSIARKEKRSLNYFKINKLKGMLKDELRYKT